MRTIRHGFLALAAAGLLAGAAHAGQPVGPVMVERDGPHTTTYEGGALCTPDVPQAPPVVSPMCMPWPGPVPPQVTYDCAGYGVVPENSSTMNVLLSGWATSDDPRVVFTSITCTIRQNGEEQGAATGSAPGPQAEAIDDIPGIPLAPFTVCASGTIYYDDPATQTSRILHFGNAEC